MDSANLKLIGKFTALLLTPYIYYFTVRGNLVKLEKKIDSKITNISDNDLNKMIIKNKKDN